MGSRENVVARYMEARSSEVENFDLRDLEFSYSRDGAYRSVSVRLDGKVMGGVSAHEIQAGKPNEFEGEEWGWPFLNEKDWGDLQALMKAAGKRNLSVYGVTSSSLDQRIRAEGIGERMYLMLLAGVSREGAALVPNQSFEGSGATSGSAMRVWQKILPLVQHVGFVAFDPSADKNIKPISPRRRRGWERYRDRYRDQKHSSSC